MSDEAIIAQVSAILEGWTPTLNKALANRVGDNWLIGGFIDGTCFYKHTGLAPDGPETPDDPIEAAYWLVAHVTALRGPTSQPEESPAPSWVFDSEPALEDIREAYEESHADDESPAVDGGDASGDYLEDAASDMEEEAADSPPDDPDLSDAVDEPDPANSGGVLIQEGTHTETILMNLRETPLRLVRDYYESRLTDEIGDENARQALHFAGTEDEFRDEKLAWVAAMDATLQEKLQAIQDETDPMALVNYRSEAEGWPAPSVEVIEYEDEQDED